MTYSSGLRVVTFEAKPGFSYYVNLKIMQLLKYAET